MSDAPSPRLVLRGLPLPARLVIAAFLLSAGVGYFSALVQLHFQAASPGELLPGAKESASIYHGGAVQSQLERLLTADERKPFNGSGSMRSAFTVRSTGWKSAINRKAKELKLDLTKEATKKAHLLQAETKLRAERDGEVLALVDWVKNGLNRKAYDDDEYPLPAALHDQPITASYVNEDKGVKKVMIKSILDNRCVRCHKEVASSSAKEAPLDSYEDVAAYSEIATAGRGMSLKKLAQTTHVHLLGFAMLYGLTGLAFCFTSYPFAARLILAPLPLVAQVVEIAVGWWGGRAYEPLALAIPVFGMVVAGGVFLHIVGALLDLFGKAGKAVVLALLVGGAVGIGALKMYIMDPYLQMETRGAVLEQGEQ
jgi:hypothetical protein